MRNSVNQCLDVILSAGCSQILSTSSDLLIGYKQASHAMERKYFEGTGNLIFFDSHIHIEESRKNVEIHKKTALEIQSPFDIDNLIVVIEAITKEMSLSRIITFQYAIGIYADVLYHMIHLLYKQKIDIKDVMGSEFNPIIYLEHAKNIFQLHEYMLNVANKIHWHYVTKINKNKSSVICSIEKYIIENISLKITLEAISELVHLSPSYVSRFFKKETGENIQDFIIKVKVERSKEMLYQNFDINDIVEATGFSTTNYFIRVFKTYTKLTPKQYIKKMNDG